MPGQTSLLGHRARAAGVDALARALNDLLGLPPPYVEGRDRGIEGEVPRDDDLLDGVETLDASDEEPTL